MCMLLIFTWTTPEIYVYHAITTHSIFCLENLTLYGWAEETDILRAKDRADVYTTLLTWHCSMMLFYMTTLSLLCVDSVGPYFVSSRPTIQHYLFFTKYSKCSKLSPWMVLVIGLVYGMHRYSLMSGDKTAHNIMVRVYWLSDFTRAPLSDISDMSQKTLFVVNCFREIDHWDVRCYYTM